ncbi:MAG: ATP-grasp domain-containing protein [Lachnospiraceae bacterium]|nr:ATP-grasp domain-containing protein [Lachnospiraceae bacterium]
MRYFKEALKGNGEVHVINSCEAPSFAEADRAEVAPGVFDKEYIPFLKHYCVVFHIRAIISLFDLGLIILARHKHEFAAIGVTIVLPDAAVVSLCQDKLKTAEYLAKHGFQVPKTYNRIQEAIRSMQNFDLFLPLVVKPRFGMGSIGLYNNIQTIPELRAVYTRSATEMENAMEQYGVPSEDRTALQGTLIQEKISGQEYSLDVICDLEGTYRNTIVKKKLAMRAGETDAAEIVDLPALRETGRKLALLLRPVGVLDVDVIMKGNTPYILEMNPRFSGSYVFSHLGGVNLPEAILYWLEQENEWKANSELANAQLNLTGIAGTAGRKILVPQLTECPTDIAIRRSSDIQEIQAALQKMESYLTPSLTERGIDITAYAGKLGENALVWMAFNKEEKPIGMIAVYSGRNYGSDTAYGTFFAIDTAYRRMHLGRRMLGIAVQELKGLGIHHFEFEVRQSNTAAIKLYLEQGCRILSVDGEDTYHMSMELDAA